MTFLMKFIGFYFVLFLSRVQCERPIKMQVADQHHCIVHVSDDSMKDFKESLEKEKKVIFFQIKYDSKQADALTKPKPDDHFANPNEYMWLFDGENGLPVYMDAPYDFQLRSFFILKEYTSTLTVNMNVSKSCNERIVSRVDFLRLVFRQLMKIVSTAQLPDKKASAYVCYDINNRKNLPDSTFIPNKQFGMNRKILLRYCCQVNDYNHKDYNNSIDLCKGKKVSSALVNDIQNYAGAFLFAFFPLLLGFISKAKLNQLADRGPQFDENIDQYLPAFGTESDWLSEHDPYFSIYIFARWLFLFEKRSPVASRIRRSLTVFACLLIIFAELLFENFTIKDKLRSYLENDVPLGYRSMMFGYKASVENTENFFGGPFVWFSVFLIVGLIVINIPDRLCQTITYSTLQQQKTWTFLVQDIEFLQRFGGLNVSNLQDYKLLHAILKSSLLTALNPSFWYAVIKQWFGRCKRVYNCFNNSNMIYQVIGVSITFLFTFICFFLCTCELLLCIVYYGCPQLLIWKAIPHSYILWYISPLIRKKTLRNLGVVLFLLSLPVFLFLYLCEAYLFLTTFQLLSSYLIYIIIALIAKPDAIAFVLLLLMLVYFLVSIAKSVSETYLSLQKLSITLAQNACQDFVYIRLGERFIYRKLFERIVRKHHPIRYEIAMALVKLILGVYILASCAYSFQRISFNMSAYIKIGLLIFTSMIPKIITVLKDTVLESRWKTFPILETIYVFQRETNFPNNVQI